MVNYVNTVLVSKLNTGAVVSYADAFSDTTGMGIPSTHVGKFVVVNCDPNIVSPSTLDVTASNAGSVQTIKVGIVTNKNNRVIMPNGTTQYLPIIKWSNEIKAADIKSYSLLDASDWKTANNVLDGEDTVTIDFSNLDPAVLAEYAKGGKRIIVRLTYKDMPHRMRKWTESYEYTTSVADLTDANNDGAEALAYKRAIVTDIANMINKEWKRARVNATVDTTTANTAKLIITALPYDDDDSVDSLSWSNKVRFNANLYWTDPAGEGWEANNKHFPKGVAIDKVPGKQYPATAKLVRDREAWAMGYQGILNRGEGTWPIIKPDMETELGAEYDGITLEFENMYRAVDDIQRKTKQTLEIYGKSGMLNSTSGTIKGILDAFVAGTQQDENKIPQ